LSIIQIYFIIITLTVDANLSFGDIFRTAAAGSSTPKGGSGGYNSPDSVYTQTPSTMFENFQVSEKRKEFHFNDFLQRIHHSGI
jgi:hypothetical protein